MRKLLSLCMLAVMTLCMATQARAYDWVDIELGETYTIPSYGKFYGKYTATESKTLTEESSSYVNVYTEEYVDAETSASALISESVRAWTGSYAPYTYKVMVEAGKTYYFVMDFPQFDAINLKLFEPEAFGIKSISPAEGSKITQLGDGDGRIYVTFNDQPKLISYARLGKTQGFSTTNTGSTKCAATLVGNTLGIDIQSVMMSLYEAGLKDGESLTLALRLQEPSGTYWAGNNNGIHKITFVAAGKPVSKVSEQVPEKVYSYMDPSDENGKLVLTFDGDLSTEIDPSQIYMEYGNKESENESDYAEFPLPFTVEGKVLTIDFTGVSRRRAELLPYSSLAPSTFVVRVRNLKDTNGNYVNSEGQGTIGSYSFEIQYEELPVVNITQEIIPASGSSLKNVESINWWFDNADHLTFDGVRFDYKDENGEAQSVVVPMSDITNASLSAAEADLTFAVPAAVKEGSNVVVRLNNLKSNDGVDHSSEMSARYDAFTILEIVPANGSVLEKLEAGQIIRVKSNMDESNPEMYLTYDLIDNNPADEDQAIVLTSYMARDEEDGSHTCEIFYDVPLYMGHTYTFRVNMYEDENTSHGQGGYSAEPMSVDEVKWTGATEPFSFSTYQFVSIDPVSGTTLNTVADNEFTLVFDGLVNLPADECKILRGPGMQASFESLTPVEPDEESGCANTWVAKVSESVMESLTDYLLLSFKAYDINGKLIEGNEGEEQSSYFYFEYPVTYNTPEFACEPADGETVESLSTFRLTFETGIYPSWLSTEKIKLVSKTETIYEFDDEAFDYEDDVDITGALYSKAVMLTLPEEVTTDGTYTLIVPDKYFTLGSEQMALYSKAQSFKYIVHAPQKAPAFTVTPEQGKVEKIGAITIKFTECNTCVRNTSKVWSFTHNGEAVTNDNGEATTFSIRGNGVQAQCAATIEGKTQYLTKDGTYVLTIPAGAYTIDGVVYENDIVLTWTIGEDEPEVLPITFSPLPEEVQPHLEYIHLVWDNEDEIGLGMGKASLTKPDGTTVTLPDAELDMELYNKAIQHLGDKHEEDGNYVVTFPAGYFTLGAEGDREEKEVNVTYTVSRAVSVGDLLNPANGLYTIYDVNGLLIGENVSIDAVKALPAGIYVINGQTFILR